MIMDMDSVGVVGPTAFKELLAAGSVQNAAIRASTQGLVIALKVGTSDFVLGRSRGGVRYFHSIDGAASVLIQHGICQFDSDVTGWLPRTLTRNKGGELLGGTSDEP
ncbi:partition protein [Shigella sonnei]|nr:partition protein [Shigella sonnei]EFV2640616.1 partition protein [Shigella sonnei]